ISFGKDLESRSMLLLDADVGDTLEVGRRKSREDMDVAQQTAGDEILSNGHSVKLYHRRLEGENRGRARSKAGRPHPCPERNRSASMAAMQPVPAAVTACR